MRRVLVAVLALLAARAVTANEAKLDERVSLNLSEAPVALVLKSLEDVLSMKVDIDPEITGSVSIRLDNVRVRTILQAICESMDCEWRKDGGTLFFVAGQEKLEDLPAGVDLEGMNLDLKDADATGVFDSLARLLEAGLVLDPTVDGKLSIELENVGLEEALRQICEALECTAELLIEGNKRTLEVSAAGR